MMCYYLNVQFQGQKVNSSYFISSDIADICWRVCPVVYLYGGVLFIAIFKVDLLCVLCVPVFIEFYYLFLYPDFKGVNVLF